MKNTNQINRIIFFVFALVLIIAESNAKEKGTPHFISAGADINANIYFANFNKFEGIDNCCTTFGNTFGLGYNVHLGYEFQLPTKLLGMPWRLDLSFAYSDLSANFKEIQPFANIINGNSHVKATAEYSITPKVQSIMFDPGIFFTPFTSTPLQIRIGFQVGFLSAMDFSQEERLIKPSEIYYENGKRVRGQYSGAIPNAAMQYFALSIGARLHAADFGNFAIYPSLRFNYGLSELVQNLDWTASSLQGGISIVYNFPKPEYPKPAAPPMPPLPEPTQPPAPAHLAVNINTIFNGKYGEEFELTFTSDEEQTDYYLLPYIFFNQDSDIPIATKTSGERNIGEARAQANLTKALAQLLEANPEYNLTLVSSSLSSESEQIINNRISKISNGLVANGVDISKINVSKRSIEPEDIQKPELLTENIYIKFNISGHKGLIPYSHKYIIDRKYLQKNVLQIIPEIKSSDKLADFEGNIYNNKRLIKKFDEKGTSFNIDNELPLSVNEELQNFIFSYDVFAKNAGGAKAKLSGKVKLTPIEERKNIRKNTLQADGKQYSQYILCYFEFDEAEPYIVNKDVLNEIKDAIAADKQIQLIALTDNIGEKEYNNRLATKRGKAAFALLKGLNGNINISEPDNYLFANDTPLGRMLNRTVVVRIPN